MEKVKVTRDQEQAIKQAIRLHGEDYVVDSHCLKKNNGLQWNLGLDALNDFEVWQLAKAVYIGYEIEPEFKKGDYVMVKWKDRQEEGFYRVVEILPVGSIQIETLDGSPNSSGYENTRHATPEEIKQEKERRWWAKHGREPWELRKFDILRNLSGDVHEVTSVDGYGMYHINHVFVPIERIRKSFKLICPVENRLDLSN